MLPIFNFADSYIQLYIAQAPHQGSQGVLPSRSHGVDLATWLRVKISPHNPLPTPHDSCPHSRSLRYDKYEKKPKYWYEEDLEMEWEKTKERSVSKQTNMEAATSGAGLAAAMTNPMKVDMDMASRGAPVRILN